MLFIFDMDGVLYRGSEPVPYAADAISALRAAGQTVRFLTNNAARPRPKYIPLLHDLGISVTVEDVVTSAYATALHFNAQGWNGCSVYVVGEEGLRDELVGVAGCRLVESDDEPAAAVVVGVDRAFTYDKMRIAQQHLLAGAHFVCTNRDPTFPVENGRVVPGAGSVVAAVATAAGREPFNVGKPNAYSIELLARMTNHRLSDTIVIGDRLDTDIAAGMAAGAETVLVLTGVTTRCEADNLMPSNRPDLVLDDLSHLPEKWTTPLK
jgi:4-nitrophenyl phosphatase